MTRQILDIGSAANDGTGTKWRAGGDIINDNFLELYTTGGLTNVTIINSLADFPDPVGGVIEIGGGIDTYLFQAGEVDISPNVIKITGGVVVFRGTNRYTSQLITTSSDPLITIVNCFYADEFMNFSNVNGPIYDVDNSGVALGAFVSINAVIRECTTVGNINNTNTISLRTVTLVTASVGGMTFSGTGLFQINISNMLGFEWAGTLIDLGTATWDLINISTGNRFISPGGTTIISGAASSANLTTEGVGLVEGNIFNGDGTALSGITTEDLQWEFKGNLFVDKVTNNTRNDADSFLTATETVTIGSATVYVAIGGTNWDSSIAERFTVSTAGLITYIGLSNLEIEIQATSTVEKVGGGADKICTKIAIDTGSGFVVQDRTIGCTENATATGVLSMGFFEVNTGDKIQLFTANLDSTANIVVSESTMLVKAI